VSRRALREARRYLLAAALAELALLLVRRPGNGLVLLGSTAVALVFFRDPERRVQREPGAVYAAADGVVVAVEPTRDPLLGDRDAVQISTFLSLQNVHVNRSPVAGRVCAAEEVGGGFAPALFGRAESNLRRRVAIDGDHGRVVVVQIAGSVARRIASWVEVGQRVAAGQRIGLIHFGSRAHVVLPADIVVVTVTVGSRVRGGVSVLARYRDREEGTECGSTSHHRTSSPAAV
jgi:phosphatidylserine decarboxylase